MEEIKKNIFVSTLSFKKKVSGKYLVPKSTDDLWSCNCILVLLLSL